MASSTALIALPMASGPNSHKIFETSNKKAVTKLKSNLIRYARNNDRRMIIRSLKDVKCLSSMLLDPVQPSEIPLPELEKEVIGTTLILNGVPFKANGNSRKSGSCLEVMKSVLSRFGHKEGVNVEVSDVYEQLVIRLAKTTASTDPYFRINSLLGSKDLVVMPISPETMPQKTPTIASFLYSSEPDPVRDPTPINMTLYESNGEIHLTLSEIHHFGLFRKSDDKPNRPWIVIDAVVTERANLSNGQSVRMLNMKLPDLY